MVTGKVTAFLFGGPMAFGPAAVALYLRCRGVRVAIATSSVVPPGFDDDELLDAALTRRGASASCVRWDASGADWRRFDRVVIRSTWDYTTRLDEFLDWADSVGERLSNSPAVVRWNSDKRYLGDLRGAGLAVVPTAYLTPGDPLPELSGEIVVKPAVSAGGRDTGRFGPEAHHEARRLLRRLTAAGRVAMVQPYQHSVDLQGETALVFLDGAFSHALRKAAVLEPDEIAPIRDDPLGAAEVMYDPELVVAGSSSEPERSLGEAVIGYLADRFGEPPLFARVDVLPAEGGEPTLLELEVIEPNLYLHTAPGAADRLAEAIVSDAAPFDGRSDGP